jgi:hypothetical protein
MALTTTFADRLLNISVTGNLVRLELGIFQLPAPEGQAPQLSGTQTVVIPLDGFVPAFGMMESVVRQLVKYGVLKAQPPEERDPASVN